MEITLNVESDQEKLEYLFRFFNLIQPELHKLLTDCEVKLISAFCALPPQYEYHRFSTVARKKVRDNLKKAGWKLSPQALNQKLYSMIDKEFLWRDEDRIIYLSSHIKTLVQSMLKTNTFNLSLNINNSAKTTVQRDSDNILPNVRSAGY